MRKIWIEIKGQKGRYVKKIPKIYVKHVSVPGKRGWLSKRRLKKRRKWGEWAGEKPEKEIGRYWYSD